MKKCYTVSITVEAMLIAESEHEAEEMAADVLREEFDNCTNPPPFAHESTRYADGWSAKCLVYHKGHQDITAEEALVLNMTQEKQKA